MPTFPAFRWFFFFFRSAARITHARRPTCGAKVVADLTRGSSRPVVSPIPPLSLYDRDTLVFYPRRPAWHVAAERLLCTWFCFCDMRPRGAPRLGGTTSAGRHSFVFA